MKPLFTSTQIRNHDHHLITNIGIPSISLMEIAGRECARFIHENFTISSVTIYCGSGNNGGDGFVIARWLHIWGWKVKVVIVSPPKTADSIANKAILPPEINCTDSPSEQFQSAYAIDALLGTGQNRALNEKYANCVRWINAQNPVKLISIDVPTGRDPDTGSPLGADYLSPNICLTIGALKIGLFCQSYGMQIHEIDIGFALSPLPQAPAYLLEEKDVVERLPKYSPSVAKWDKGHVAIFAKGGAAVLASNAALISGVGLVTLLCPKDEWSSLHGLRPEVILSEPENLTPKRHNALIVGPNIGFSPSCRKFLKQCWKQFSNPIVVDADAIRIIAEEEWGPVDFPRIFTPHISEAAHLLGKSKTHILHNPILAINELQHHGITLLKGPFTKISNRPTYVSPVECDRLAIAGSGDILSGLIGGFIAQQINPIDSLIVSCIIHAQTGGLLKVGDSATELLSLIKITHQKIFEKIKVL